MEGADLPREMFLSSELCGTLTWGKALTPVEVKCMSRDLEDLMNKYQLQKIDVAWKKKWDESEFGVA